MPTPIGNCPPDQIDDLRTGNRHLKVRLYDVTELPGSRSSSPNSLQEFDATLVSPGDLHLPIAIDDRDYLVEVGYNDGDGRWYSLAKSASVRVPACIEAPAAAPVSPEPVVLPTVEAGLHSLAGTAVAGTAAAATGLGLAATQLPAVEPEPELVLEPEPALELESALEPESTPAPSYGAGTRSDLSAESKIILVPRSANAAYAYWEAAEVHKDALKAEGGRALALRILDATNLELDYQAPHSLQEYILQDTDQDKHVAIPTPDRDYVAELGYLTDSGDWLRLMRSLHVRVPNS
jgi:phosphate transport system substrate-binding protein